MIPFRYPLNPVVVPAPGIVTFVRTAVTPNPIWAPARDALIVLIPILWSAKLSITQTFNPFAQEPGFFAAYVKFVPSSWLFW